MGVGKRGAHPALIDDVSALVEANHFARCELGVRVFWGGTGRVPSDPPVIFPRDH